MHEFSIATALLDLVAQHTPRGTKLRRVIVEAGPLQGIDPDAMQWAWQSITSGSPYEGSAIEVHPLPWRLHCPACGNDFTAPDLLAKCACGSEQAHPLGGGDELRLKSLVVDDEATEPQVNTDK